MFEFSVSDAFAIETDKRPGGRRLHEKAVEMFWQTAAATFGKKRGCYVFSMRAGKGYTPWYVGKATVSFKQEIFTAEKLRKYGDALLETKKGTPVVFFVCRPSGKGVPGPQTIDDLENYLIRTCSYKNENLINKHKRPKELWAVRGVFNSGVKPSKAALAFRSAIGFE
jgi:hypothetical protein